MRLSDFFNFGSYDQRIGPNDLPRDVQEDLLKGGSPPVKHESPYKDDQRPRTYKRSHGLDGIDQHDTNNEIQRMFHEMDTMFKNFFGDFQHRQTIPSLGGLDEIDGGENKKNKSLRDKMIDNRKDNVIDPFEQDGDTFHQIFEYHNPPSMFQGFFNSFFNNEFNERSISKPNEDYDLDDDVKNGVQSIDDILNDGAPNNNSFNDGHNNNSFFDSFIPHGHSSSSYTSSTITKKINPDGSVEMRSTKRDSDGNEEVVVTRTVGDETHTTKSITTKDGKVSTENLVKQDGQNSSLVSPRDYDITKSWKDFWPSWWKPL